MARAKTFDAAAQLIKNKLPQKGFFSVLDELINAAPFEKAPAKEWQGYLQPGKLLEREGVKFPLKKEELEYAEMARALADLSEAGPTIEKAGLMEHLQKLRPGFNTTIRSEEDAGQLDKLKELAERYGARTSYGDPNFGEYAHRGVPYSESITSSPEFGQFQTHFGLGALSHSRRTVHRLPSEKQLNLIEEIQSDRHQAAAERVMEPGYIGNDTTGGPRRGYRTGEEEIELTKLGMAPSNDPEGFHWRENRLRELRAKPPDAPFKDPKEYGELEMKKQLLDAVNEDADFLGLARGSDQIERYSGLNPAGRKGMEYIYDQVYPSALKKLAHRYGADLGEVKADVASATNEPQVLQDLGIDFLDFLEGTQDELVGAGADQPGTGGPVRSFLTQMGRDLPEEEGAISAAKDSLEQLTNSESRFPGPQGETTSSADLWSELETNLRALYGIWKNKHAAANVTEKSFPALELTPELKALVKKVGVPIWALAGASVLPPETEGPQYAEGGKVEKKPERRVDALRRIASGLRSQIYSSPVEGHSWLENQLPGLVNETLSLPTLLEYAKPLGKLSNRVNPIQRLLELISQDPDYMKKEDEKLDQAKPPEWSTRAGERAERGTELAREAHGLDAPQGFLENAAESGGVMLGQLPLPASRVKSGVGLAGKVGRGAKRAALSGLDYLGPTIDPKLSNYLLGSGFGGILGGLGQGSSPKELDELAKKYTNTPSEE